MTPRRYELTDFEWSRYLLLCEALESVREDPAIAAFEHLFRERSLWHGQTHTVLVREEGFEYQGKRYASLSEIARLITGAHWSGPRFFGLRRISARRRKAAAGDQPVICDDADA